ncbi:MAG: S26 family signal peptidase [Verrucomicrobiales bacterium]
MTGWKSKTSNSLWHNGEDNRARLPKSDVPKDGYNGYLGNHLFNLEEDQYLALGDNSMSSLDSRYWGHVPAKNIVGRAIFVYSFGGTILAPSIGRSKFSPSVKPLPPSPCADAIVRASGSKIWRSLSRSSLAPSGGTCGSFTRSAGSLMILADEASRPETERRQRLDHWRSVLLDSTPPASGLEEEFTELQRRRALRWSISSKSSKG